jgi:hypothetical protein
MSNVTLSSSILTIRATDEGTREVLDVDGSLVLGTLVILPDGSVDALVNGQLVGNFRRPMEALNAVSDAAAVWA